MNTQLKIDPAECAELIRYSQAMAVLTGAGVSTAAGIPDFRGPQGLYVTRRYDPEKVFAIEWFYREPGYFYEFSRDFIGLMKMTAPTFTHRFLARLEREGHLKGIITQNIDALHSRAGSGKVIELHGSYRSAGCRGCGRHRNELTYEWWDTAMETSSSPPLVFCQHCNGIMKPDIVFFGEPVTAITEAKRVVTECDLLLVLGSSLQVTPASLLPHCTTRTTIIINKGRVTLSPAPHRRFVDADLDQFSRAVASCLGMAD
jgi:NAD-dependent deacetylase